MMLRVKLGKNRFDLAYVSKLEESLLPFATHGDSSMVVRNKKIWLPMYLLMVPLLVPRPKTSELVPVVEHLASLAGPWSNSDSRAGLGQDYCSYEG